MKEEEQTENWQELKGDDRENKKIETSSQKNKPKEVTLEKKRREKKYRRNQTLKHNQISKHKRRR